MRLTLPPASRETRTDWRTGKVLDLPTILDRPGRAALRSHTGITISSFMYSFLSVVVVVVEMKRASRTAWAWLAVTDGVNRENAGAERSDWGRTSPVRNDYENIC